jgi:putative FmdB family regulatory protein
MPTYDYNCPDCGHHLEAFQKITDNPLKECPKCRKPSLLRGPGGGIGLSFVGSGWFKSDYGPSEAKSSGSESTPKETESTPKAKCCPCGHSKGSCPS